MDTTARCELASEDWVEALGYSPLPLLEHMTIRVRGQHDRAVAEQVLHVLEREALSQEESRGCVTEVMESPVGEARAVLSSVGR